MVDSIETDITNTELAAQRAAVRRLRDWTRLVMADIDALTPDREARLRLHSAVYRRCGESLLELSKSVTKIGAANE